MSLKEITDHIYGRANVLMTSDRPNMFVKELMLYIDYLNNKIEELKNAFNKKQESYLTGFINNLNDGIAYYESLFNSSKDVFRETKESLLKELDSNKKRLQHLHVEIGKMGELNTIGA